LKFVPPPDPLLKNFLNLELISVSLTNILSNSCSNPASERGAQNDYFVIGSVLNGLAGNPAALYRLQPSGFCWNA